MKKQSWIEDHPVWTGIIFIFVLMFFIDIFLSDSSNVDFEKIEMDASYSGGEMREEVTRINDDFSKISELHWRHLPIKYFIKNEKECGTYESGKIDRAFNEISESTNKTLYFEKINNSAEADIELFCSFIENCYKIETWKDGYWEYKEESICEHELGIAQITETEGNKIIKAEIELIGLGGFSETSNRVGKEMSGFYVGTCGDSNTEIHEILHVFGFGHSQNQTSIMYPHEMRESGYKISDNNCEDVIVGIDEEYSSCLKYIYSNGVYGTCSGIQESIYVEDLYDYGCEEGTYVATNDPNSCCPGPDMWVDEYYCY
jgi:hypothetical protein